MIHTCPRCELRFQRDAELRDHLARDHNVSPESIEPLHYEGRSRSRSGAPDGRRVLVVANRTLHSDELLARIREFATSGPTRFFLLVPADAGAGETPDEAGRLADWRLRHLVDLLHEEGIDAEGAVGDSDPFRAVERTLERERFDQILLSTLRPGLSRLAGLRPGPPPGKKLPTPSCPCGGNRLGRSAALRSRQAEQPTGTTSTPKASAGEPEGRVAQCNREPASLAGSPSVPLHRWEGDSDRWCGSHGLGHPFAVGPVPVP